MPFGQRVEQTKDSILIATKDRRTGQERVVAIGKAEFVRRYLQHALPQGFRAIRYYGFLHPRAKEKLAAIRERLGVRFEAGEAERPEAEQSPLPQAHGAGRPAQPRSAVGADHPQDMGPKG